MRISGTDPQIILDFLTQRESMKSVGHLSRSCWNSSRFSKGTVTRNIQLQAFHELVRTLTH
jgi:hypothetical protein